MKVLTALAVMAASWLGTGWFLMLLMGVLHADWWPIIPTMSYGTALAVAAVLMLPNLVKALLGLIMEAAA